MVRPNDDTRIPQGPASTPQGLPQQALIAILRTGNLLESRFATRIEHSGLTPPQFNVLRILRGAGEALPTMEISDRMIHRTPGITRLLDRLEATGLIARERSSRDRRQVFCTITDAGLALLATLDPVIDEFDGQTLATLPDEELATLVALLERVRTKLA